jgi:hypothetical protein
MLFLLVHWYPLQAPIIDMTWLVDVVLCHSIAFVIAAAAFCTIQSLFKQLEVSRFEAVCHVSTPLNDALPRALRVVVNAPINSLAALTANFSFHLSAYACRVDPRQLRKEDPVLLLYLPPRQSAWSWKSTTKRPPPQPR